MSVAEQHVGKPAVSLKDSDFNISEAARRLGMHRRTLARKLAKRQVG